MRQQLSQYATVSSLCLQSRYTLISSLIHICYVAMTTKPLQHFSCLFLFFITFSCVKPFMRQVYFVDQERVWSDSPQLSTVPVLLSHFLSLSSSFISNERIHYGGVIPMQRHCLPKQVVKSGVVKTLHQEAKVTTKIHVAADTVTPSPVLPFPFRLGRSGRRCFTSH